MAFDFKDFDIADWLKKQVPAWLGQFGNGIGGMFTGVLGFFAKALGIPEMLKERYDAASGIITEKIDKPLAEARRIVPNKVAEDAIYVPIADKFKIDDKNPIYGKLKTIMHTHATNFLTSAGLELENGAPTKAVEAAAAAHPEIVTALKGIVSKDDAILIADYLTGVDASADGFLASNLPKNGGLVDILADAQVALSKKTAITEQSLVFKNNLTAFSTADAQAQADQAVAANKNVVSGGKDAETPQTPPATPPKPAPVLAVNF